METPTKTVLVNMSDNSRVVTFATSSDVDDAEALSVAIKATFADILLPKQTFLCKFEEWAGVLVDLRLLQYDSLFPFPACIILSYPMLSFLI